MGKLLEIQNLTKTFGGLTAVGDVTFSIDQGAIFGLIGPNGSGKSVTFNAISGVYKSDKGTVVFDRDDITNLPPHVITQKGMARTFQGSRVFLSLSVLENVMVGRHCRTKTGSLGALFRTGFMRQEDKESMEKAQRAIELVGSGLVEAMNTPVKDLTYVMRTMTGIAIALVTSPKILLVDEPLAGMNPTEITNTMELFRTIRDSGITIFLVEHNMKAVMNLCDRIMVLNMGKKIAEGTPKEVSKNEEVIQAYLGGTEYVEA